jgi:prepilin-type N-terminal cleavage/methylation domain-containing protein
LSHDRPTDGGLTLIELLVAVAIMGIAFLAIMGAIGTAILSTATHRAQATSQTLLRRFAENVKSTESPYVKCPTLNDYGRAFTNPTPSPTPGGWSADEISRGYSATVTAIDEVVPVTSTVTATATYSPIVPSGSCPSNDSGAQRVTIKTIGPEGKVVLTEQIFKRCEEVGTRVCPAT